MFVFSWVMVDRTGEIRRLQAEAFGPVVRIEVEEARSDFWAGLVSGYSWTAERSSSTGLQLREVLSIEKVAERTLEIASRVHQLRGIHSRDANSIELQSLLSECKWLQTEAVEHLKRRREADQKSKDREWGMRTIRSNLHGRYVRVLQSAIAAFEEEVAELRKDEQATAKRRLRQAGLEDEKKIDQIVSSGEVEQVMKRALSENLSTALDSISDRHQSIVRLERDIVQLQELFVQIGALVEMQQESIDSIESHVGNAKDYVRQGAQALENGEKDQNTSRKLTCCILIIVVVALAAIASALVLKTQTNL